MVERKVLVKNPSGLHMAPANKLAKLACACTSDIEITDGIKTVNPKSLLMLLSTAISCGSLVTVSCSGPDEEKDLQTIVEAIENGLGEL